MSQVPQHATPLANNRDQSEVLVFCLAINGYQWHYKDNIASHRAYCEKHGFSYQCITQPRISVMGKECVWLKVALMRQALLAGFKWVVCLDADTDIKSDCPDFRAVAEPDKCIMAANGYSDRLNSGVVMARSCADSCLFFGKLLEICEQNIPVEDQVGWGENGHFIYLAKDKPYLQTLSAQWNNNRDAEMDDFIRHYSRGPLFRLKKIGLLQYGLFMFDQFMMHFLRIGRRLEQRKLGTRDQDYIKADLAELLYRVLQRYPLFTPQWLTKKNSEHISNPAVDKALAIAKSPGECL